MISFGIILVSFSSLLIVVCDMLFVLGFVLTLNYLSLSISLIQNSSDKKMFLPKQGTEYIMLTLFLFVQSGILPTSLIKICLTIFSKKLLINISIP